MRTVREHEYTTYPRRFDAYRWYKPLAVGAFFLIFTLIAGIALDVITKSLFGAVSSSTGYDDMDFFSTAGAFYNAASAALAIPCLILAALIVRDRPVSSYWSSMGGWRWKTFLKTLAAAFVILGIPTILYHVIHGRTGDIRFTIGGFIILTLLIPLQGIGFGSITAEQTVPDVAFNIFFKTLFFIFIIYADRKLKWFDEVKTDDVTKFNARVKK